VQLLGTLNEAESRAKLAMKRFRVITHYFEPAAFRRSFRAKRADNDMAAVLDRASHSVDISIALLLRGEKMEDSAVVPNIICGWREFHCRNVGCDPVNTVGRFFQTFLCHVDCGLRYIKNGDVLIKDSLGRDRLRHGRKDQAYREAAGSRFSKVDIGDGERGGVLVRLESKFIPK